MHIGLIGGIGPAATDFYYRRFVKLFAQAGAPLTLTMAHADIATLRDNLTKDDRSTQARIFEGLAHRLARAGAECVVVTSIAGHFCRAEFRVLSPLPTIDIVVEVDRAVAARGLRRVGVIGTKTVMENRFYGGLTTATTIPPASADLDEIHDAYITMAASGVATPAQRDVFRRACRWFVDREGAEAIMLGGTDLALVFDETETEFPLIDCAAIHVDAIATLAMGGAR